MKWLDKLNGWKSVLGFGAVQFIDGKLWVLEAVRQVIEQGVPALSAAVAHIVLFGGIVHKVIKEAKK